MADHKQERASVGLEGLRKFRDIYLDYGKACELAARFEDATAALADINGALRTDTHRFFTDQNFGDNGSDVYVYDALKKEYAFRRKVFTSGRFFSFSGDELAVKDSKLLLVDRSRLLGVSIRGIVVVKTQEEAKGIEDRDGTEKLLSRMGQAPPGVIEGVYVDDDTLWP